MSKQLFVFLGVDKVGVQRIRARIRPSHRKYLRDPNLDIEVLLGGPTVNGSEKQMDGTLLIIKANSIQDVERFIENDPYSRAEIFSQKIIRPWIPGIIKELTI